MPTRFILVKFCRPTLIQKLWVCGLVVQGADLWGTYVCQRGVSREYARPINERNFFGQFLKPIKLCWILLPSQGCNRGQMSKFIFYLSYTYVGESPLTLSHISSRETRPIGSCDIPLDSSWHVVPARGGAFSRIFCYLGIKPSQWLGDILVYDMKVGHCKTNLSVKNGQLCWLKVSQQNNKKIRQKYPKNA